MLDQKSVRQICRGDKQRGTVDPVGSIHKQTKNNREGTSVNLCTISILKWCHHNMAQNCRFAEKTYPNTQTHDVHVTCGSTRFPVKGRTQWRNYSHKRAIEASVSAEFSRDNLQATESSSSTCHARGTPDWHSNGQTTKNKNRHDRHAFTRDETQRPEHTTLTLNATHPPSCEAQTSPCLDNDKAGMS